MAQNRRFRAARALAGPPQQCERLRGARTQINQQSVEAKTQTPDIERRKNAGWLRLWRTVYPNTPPPVEVQSSKSKVHSPAKAEAKL